VADEKPVYGLGPRRAARRKGLSLDVLRPPEEQAAKEIRSGDASNSPKRR